jgi:hypothetical protein
MYAGIVVPDFSKTAKNSLSVRPLRRFLPFALPQDPDMRFGRTMKRGRSIVRFYSGQQQPETV